MKIEQLKQILNEQIVNVTFIKKDGTERTMICTTKPDTISTLFETPDNKTQTTIKYNENQIRVVDLEKQQWRSFSFDSITSITINIRKSNDDALYIGESQ